MSEQTNATRKPAAARGVQRGMRLNHNLTVLRGLKLNHNQTVLVVSH